MFVINVVLFYGAVSDLCACLRGSLLEPAKESGPASDVADLKRVKSDKNIYFVCLFMRLNTSPCHEMVQPPHWRPMSSAPWPATKILAFLFRGRTLL